MSHQSSLPRCDFDRKTNLTVVSQVTNAVNVDDPVPQQPSIVTSPDPVEMIETEMTDVALVRLLPTSTDMSQAKKPAPLLLVA